MTFAKGQNIRQPLGGIDSRVVNGLYGYHDHGMAGQNSSINFGRRRRDAAMGN